MSRLLHENSVQNYMVFVLITRASISEIMEISYPTYHFWKPKANFFGIRRIFTERGIFPGLRTIALCALRFAPFLTQWTSFKLITLPRAQS